MAAKKQPLDSQSILNAVALLRANRAPAQGATGVGGPGKSVPRRSNAAYLRNFDKARARQSKAKKAKEDSGFSLGDLGDVGANVVESALNIADVPRTYITSHVADIAGAAESGDLGKALEATANTINPAVGGATLAAGAADALGIAPDTMKKIARHGFVEKKHARDYLEHTGTGTYLQRGIDRHKAELGFLNKSVGGHVPGTPIDVGISGADLVGFGGDVGLDPLTYLTGGASDIVKGGGKAGLKAIVEAGDKAAAEAVAARGLDAARAGVPEAVRLQAKNAIETGVKHEFDKALKEAAGKGHGLRNISNPDVYKAVTGNTGGIRFRVPGTGRYGRQIGRMTGATNVEEKLASVPLLGKSTTDKLNPLLDKVKGATQTLGENTFGKISRKGELNKLLRDPNSTAEQIRKALAAETADVVANARKEAALRFVRRESDAQLREDMKHPGLHPVQSANAEMASKLGPDALHEYQNIRKMIKKEGEANVIDAIESGRTHESSAATALADWFDRFHETATANGVDIAHRANYVPRTLSENARRLVEGDAARGGVLRKGSFEYAREEENSIRKLMAQEAKRTSGLDIKPEDFTSAETRAYGEKLAQLHYGDKLKGSYYETSIDKMVLKNVDSLKERIYQLEKQRRLLDDGVLQRLPEHGVTDPGAVKATEHKIKAIDSAIAKLKKRLAKTTSKRADLAGAGTVDEALNKVPTSAEDLIAQTRVRGESLPAQQGMDLSSVGTIAQQTAPNPTDLQSQVDSILAGYEPKPTASPELNAAKLAQEAPGEPTVTLWRGEGAGHQGAARGDFFYPSEEYAQNFAGPDGIVYKVDVPQSVAEAGGQVAAQDGHVGVSLPPDWADSAYPRDMAPAAPVEDAIIRAPRTKAAKEKAYQQTLDLSWSSAADPTTPESIQRDLEAATNMAAEEQARGIKNGFQAQRAKALAEAARTQDRATAKALKIQADALAMQDQLRELYKSRSIESQTLERLRQPAHQEALRKEFQKGKALLEANPELAGDRDMVDILNKMDNVSGDPEHFKRFIAGYDKALNYVKKWQLATPGFHTRNFMGGMYNNYLAGVEFGAHMRFLNDLRKYKNGSLAADRVPMMEDLLAHLNTGQYSAVEAGAAKRFGRHISPIGVYLDANREAGAHVEQLLRGALGYDRLLKGKGIDQALSDIVRFHFDYQDLSSFERKYVKRVVPFYSWTRNNVPLQVEMYLQAPQKYARYIQAQNEIKSPLDPGTIGTSQLASAFGIPIDSREGGKNGGQQFLTPDLPMTQTLANVVPDISKFNTSDAPNSLLDVAAPLIGNVSPLIKMPYELAHGQQVFKGIPFKDRPFLNKNGKAEPNPVYAQNPALLEALKALGLAQDTKQGIRITDNGQYALEQVMPALARVRKLAPTSTKDKARESSSRLSFLGLPLHTNTQYEQDIERLMRKKAKAAAKQKPRY